VWNGAPGVFNVCARCGEYTAEKVVDPKRSVAICPFCGYAEPFLRQPLFVVTGASGAGKTAVCRVLTPQLRRRCVVLEGDILWGAVAASADDDSRSYRTVWLRLAKNVGQVGLPVVLCGTALPDQFETGPERRYFSTLYYLALICDEATLRERLRQRPAWRQTQSNDFLERMAAFNRWLIEHAPVTTPPMTLLDTSTDPLEETVAKAQQWIEMRL
jgi:AAA domain